MSISRRYGVHTGLGLAATALLLIQAPATAADIDEDKRAVAAAIDRRADDTARLARAIWDEPELGYQEQKSSTRLRSELGEFGFSVRPEVAGMPTAFIASYGRGRPVIGLLAEFDALPGMSQAAVPERKPLRRGAAGHACGHHLFGTGVVAAAIAVREWMWKAKVGGTLRVFGTPAEEGGAGKAYLARAGLFDDVDIVLHWHPDDHNQVTYASSLANKSAKFRFHGEAAHASAAPEKGRSALDGVEAMNFMTNLLREHVPEPTRIHYIITHGGEAPNIVPDFAEVFYYARHPDPRQLAEIWERLVAASEGAAQGTGTRVENEVIHGSHSLLPNETLSRRLDANFRIVGGVHYDDEEAAFAEKLYKTLREPGFAIGSQEVIQPLAYWQIKASTDVGDVSWIAPTGGIRAATWVPGTPSHSWQATAAGGTSIGAKGMIVAAKVLAMTMVDVLRDPGIAERARAEMEERRGPDFQYRPLVGDRDPPLDYRAPAQRSEARGPRARGADSR